MSHSLPWRRITYFALAAGLLVVLASDARADDGLIIRPMNSVSNNADGSVYTTGAEIVSPVAVSAEPELLIIPRQGTVDPGGVGGPEIISRQDMAARYAAAKNAIPFDRTLHESNPTYRHEAALAITFGQLPPTAFRQGYKVERDDKPVQPASYWMLKQRDTLNRRYLSFPYNWGLNSGLFFGAGPVPGFPAGPAFPGFRLFPRAYQPFR